MHRGIADTWTFKHRTQKKLTVLSSCAQTYKPRHGTMNVANHRACFSSTQHIISYGQYATLSASNSSIASNAHYGATPDNDWKSLEQKCKQARLRSFVQSTSIPSFCTQEQSVCSKSHAGCMFHAQKRFIRMHKHVSCMRQPSS